ncbi:MAG: ergot alkaloid biosynthesis protein [Pseudorhodobacter sp. PARRP1]|nr:MAG: ergot alkaloid biosynthesis protein [Pseudorhodobacter sp. PARRP1]
MHDRILVTGGTGKTGRRTASQLGALGVPVLAASRQSNAQGSVVFDWLAPETYAGALDAVRAVYLVAPPGVSETLAVMRPFLEQAVTSGVKRFVLLSASSVDEGGPVMGQVHAWLRANAPQWVVLRPTWFMQNFSEGPHRVTICQSDTIYSATGSGRVGFIDADDIAAVAARMLVRPDVPNGELLLTGPDAMSYNEVAEQIAVARGRPIGHRNLDEDALRDRHVSDGVPVAFAGLLAAMDTSIAHGSEDRVTGEVERITGRPAQNFATFAKAAAGLWTHD